MQGKGSCKICGEQITGDIETNEFRDLYDNHVINNHSDNNDQGDKKHYRECKDRVLKKRVGQVIGLPILVIFIPLFILFLIVKVIVEIYGIALNYIYKKTLKPYRFLKHLGLF